MPQPPDMDTRLADLEGTLKSIQAENGQAKMRFYTIAKCLVEIAIENQALWKLVRRYVPTQRWPPAEIREAREEFKDLESEIRTLMVNEFRDLGKLPTLVDSLRERLTRV